jgi:hypothetical protein
MQIIARQWCGCLRQRLSWAAAAALVVLAGAEPAQANYVWATFQNVSPGEVITYSLNGTSGLQTIAGQLHWITDATDAGFPPTFTTFCIELTQHVSNNSKKYTLVDLENAPSPGSGTGGAGVNGPMNTTKANQIRELWGRYYAGLGTSDQLNAAFQIAIWDIVYDDFVPDPSPTVTLAQQWLASLTGDPHYFEPNLIALSNRKAQDQITVVTPEPTTLSLVGAGLVGVLGYVGVGRRLRRRD